jgi:anti-sigma B factor antagonist
MTPGDTMTISEERQGGDLLLKPIGDVDLSRSPQMRERLAKALAQKPTRIVVDLSQVPYMDSSGVATLVEALQHCRKAGCELVLTSLHPKVRSIFEIAKLNQVFKIVDAPGGGG